MFNVLVNSFLFVFLASYSYAEPRSGIVKSYSQQSDWKKQEHKVYLEFAFDDEENLDGDENKAHSVLLDLSLEEMVEFSAEEGTLLTIINELAEPLVFQSLFQLQIGENAHVYKGKGLSIDLKAEDWGVDEHGFMVTEVSLPSVTLNGKESIHVNSITGDLLGKIFSKHAVENFIPNKMGFSTFYHYSHDGESWFMYEALSKDSHWIPSAEEMASLSKVVEVSKVQIDRAPGSPGPGRAGPLAYTVRLSDGTDVHMRTYAHTNVQPYANGGVQLPHIEVGDRWIRVGNGWLHLESALLVKPGSHGNTYQYIVKAWE